MTRMKHLLRKLHIGGDARPVINQDPSPSSSSSTTVHPSPIDRTTAIRDTANDFNFLEEEFQVQLALAISASDASASLDPESVQIKAAKRMSLGCSPSLVTTDQDSETLIEFLSLRYWNYSFVNYDEKVMDGFYDVHGITSSSTQGKMPSLVDLQAVSISENVDYEVILVNRATDSELRQLEDRTYYISMECQASGRDPISNSLIQRIADLVVHRMGGPVSDADEMLKRWTCRRSELRNSLNSVVLPLGCLDIGLSRHRALLFKVLADRINLPCMLVKGSYYTGTDEGAVNLIKIGDGSEYIIDLMGAPGSLIPSEACNRLLNPGLDGLCFSNVSEMPMDSYMLSGKRTGRSEVLSGIGTVSTKNNSKSEQAERFECDFGKLLPPLPKSCEGSAGSSARSSSSAQQLKVKDVSNYVITAAKNPNFAQKLHAVLLESGATPPSDLLLDLAKKEVIEQAELEKFFLNYEQPLASSLSLGQSVDIVGLDSGPGKPTNALDRQQCERETDSGNSDLFALALDDGRGNDARRSTALNAKKSEKVGEPSSKDLASPSQGPGVSLFVNDKSCLSQFSDNVQLKSPDRNSEIPRPSTLDISNSRNERITLMLGEVAEWEIPWEDLRIAERIGIGSCGEVFHGDWIGTEVAIKRFLDQDLTGDALLQFKCEAQIMLRLRHPNVVLFMGAVTRPPNFSILTEYLPRGSLYKLLHRPSHPPLEEKRRIRMALDVAKGMNYLHTSHPTIVHRDLKSPNLLVDKNWVVKVCDFGMSRLKHQTFLSSRSTAGTPEWMAPEVLRNEPSNEKCDVYSYGVILWELLTLRVPWSEINSMQVVGAVGFQNRRLDIPAGADPIVALIISDCWQNDQRLRPSFAQIIQRLKRVTHLYNQ